jgi:hypothetical protein
MEVVRRAAFHACVQFALSSQACENVKLARQGFLTRNMAGKSGSLGAGWGVPFLYAGADN